MVARKRAFVIRVFLACIVFQMPCMRIQAGFFDHREKNYGDKVWGTSYQCVPARQEQDPRVAPRDNLRRLREQVLLKLLPKKADAHKVTDVTRSDDVKNANVHNDVGQEECSYLKNPAMYCVLGVAACVVYYKWEAIMQWLGFSDKKKKDKEKSSDDDLAEHKNNNENKEDNLL